MPIRTPPMQETGESANSLGANAGPPAEWNRESLQVTAAAFTVLFCIVGMALWGLPFYYDFMVQHFGWQAALRTLGLLILVIALPAALLAKEPPHAKKSTVSPGFADARDAFTTIPFFLLTLGSMFSIAAVSGAQQNLKLFLSLDLHFAQSQAARILSLVLAFSIVGRLLMGWLADRFPKKYVMVLIYMLVAAAIPLLFAGRAPAAIYIFAAVFGVGLGGDYMIVPLMAAEIFGVQLLGRLLGVILTAGSVAEALSPWLVGRLRDTTGSYSAGFLVLIGMGLLGAASAAMLPKGKKPA